MTKRAKKRPIQKNEALQQYYLFKYGL